MSWKNYPWWWHPLKFWCFVNFYPKCMPIFINFLWSFHPVKVIFCQKSSGSSARNLLSFEDSSPTWNEPNTKMDLGTKISKSEDLRSFIATLGQTPSGWLGQLPWPVTNDHIYRSYCKSLKVYIGFRCLLLYKFVNMTISQQWQWHGDNHVNHNDYNNNNQSLTKKEKITTYVCITAPIMLLKKFLKKKSLLSCNFCYCKRKIQCCW